MVNKDILRLRELAKQVREIADLPVQREHKRLWQDVNDLKSKRPVLHVRDYAIYLIQYKDELTPIIEDKNLQKYEMDLLLRIYEWKHLRVNRVIEPTINCQCVINDTKFGLQQLLDIQSDEFTVGQEIKKARHFDPLILSEEDLEKIKIPVVTYDEAATMKRYSQAKEIFDGILDVKLHGSSYFACAPWDDLMSWMGITEGMYNFALEPEMMHKAIQVYLNAQTLRAKQYEELGVLSSNNGAVNVGNNGFGFTAQLPEPTESGIGAKLKDIWGENADQIMTGVSPEMTKEFAFDYEKKWAELFGMYSYGCCERLDHKIKELTGVHTNLRKISVSPFSKLEEAMEQIGDKYTVCFKPNSNYLTGDTWDKEILRKEMINVLNLARKYNSNLEINMKTLITLNGEPQRLWEWCDMASDIVNNY